MARTIVTLEQTLSHFAREGELYAKQPAERVTCHACGHRCVIPPGQRGICKVRWNESARLMVPSGYVDRLTPTRGRCPSCSTRIPGVWA